MLIAMMGNTYQKIAETKNEWQRQWARIVLVVERGNSTEGTTQESDVLQSTDVGRTPGSGASAEHVAIRDRFPRLAHWKAVVGLSVFGFACGLVYITPGGLLVLDITDKYGVTLTTLTLVMLEIVTFCWIYGVGRITVDIKFMLGRSTGWFWRACWGCVTMAIIFVIWLFSFIQYKPFDVPIGYTVFGWCLFSFIVLQVVAWGAHELLSRSEPSLCSKLVAASKPTADWGPEDATARKQYQAEVAKVHREPEECGGRSVVREVLDRMFRKSVAISKD